MMKNLTELKLLLLSFLIVLNANLIGCSNKNDESDINEILSTESSIVDDNTEDTTLETEIVVIDPKQEVMDLINYGSIEKVYYVLEDTTLSIPSYLSDNNTEESITLPKLECLEVYDQIDDMCLVKTNEYIGYVSTHNLEELTGTFVVVDISSQELKLYCDNEVVVTSPVVSWRDLDEFGGDTYLTDGSHGCVNMPRDEVMTVKEYAEIGTKVLVKE